MRGVVGLRRLSRAARADGLRARGLRAEDPRADSLRAQAAGALATDEFCCLFWGYPSRCATCPLPRAVQDLFDDGTLRADRFRAFGAREDWSRREDRSGREAPGDGLVWALQVLEVRGEAKSTAQLKKAFRERAKELHPDRGGEAEAFRELVTAYELALELLKRARRRGGGGG